MSRDFNTDGIERFTDAIDQNTDQLETLLGAQTTSIDGMATAVAAQAADLAELNAKTPDLRTDFMAGRVRSGGGKIVLTSTQTGVFQLKNPASSGKVFTISSFYLACDMSVDVSFSFDSTLTGSPVTVVPFAPNRAVASVTSAEAKTSIGVPTGGQMLSPIYRVAANTPVVQEFTVVLLPGQSVEARIGIGALSNATFYVSATWSEDPT